MTPISTGDSVLILSSDVGYRGKIGTVSTVFRSGRYMVSIGPVVMLNLPPRAVAKITEGLHSRIARAILNSIYDGDTSYLDVAENCADAVLLECAEHKRDVELENEISLGHAAGQTKEKDGDQQPHNGATADPVD